MPFMKDGRRDYKRENALYNAKPEQKKNRAARNAARAKMMKAGKASKGDGKDVAHLKAISKGGLGQMYNLQMQSKAKNRSFSKTSTSKMKSETSKREKKK
jgi:hypothetical protein